MRKSLLAKSSPTRVTDEVSIIDLPTAGSLPDGAFNDDHLGTLDAVRGAVHPISKGRQRVGYDPFVKPTMMPALCSLRTAGVDVYRSLLIAMMDLVGQGESGRSPSARTTQRPRNNLTAPLLSSPSAETTSVARIAARRRAAVILPALRPCAGR